VQNQNFARGQQGGQGKGTGGNYPYHPSGAAHRIQTSCRPLTVIRLLWSCDKRFTGHSVLAAVIKWLSKRSYYAWVRLYMFYCFVFVLHITLTYSTVDAFTSSFLFLDLTRPNPQEVQKIRPKQTQPMSQSSCLSFQNQWLPMTCSFHDS